MSKYIPEKTPYLDTFHAVDIISTVKLLAVDTLLFSIVHDGKTTVYERNKDL